MDKAARGPQSPLPPTAMGQSSASQTPSHPPGCLVEGHGPEPVWAKGQASGCNLAPIWPACPHSHPPSLRPILQHQCLCRASCLPREGAPQLHWGIRLSSCPHPPGSLGGARPHLDWVPFKPRLRGLFLQGALLRPLSSNCLLASCPYSGLLDLEEGPLPASWLPQHPL